MCYTSTAEKVGTLYGDYAIGSKKEIKLYTLATNSLNQALYSALTFVLGPS